MTIFAIWAAGLGAAAQFGKMSVAYPALEAVYAGQAGIGIGVMLSIVGTVGLVFGTTAGLWVARVGARRALVAALALGAVASALQIGLPPYPVMLATRVLEGLSHLVIVVVGPTAIAGLAPGRGQGAAMTLWSSFFGVAYAVLFYVGPDLLADHGPGLLFGLHAIWMAVAALVLWLLLPGEGGQAQVKRRASLWAEHRAIYASPRLAAPAMGFVCYTVTYVAVLTILPAQMGDMGGFIGVAMPLVSIAVSLTLGIWLLGRMSAVRLVQRGFAAAMLAAGGLWLSWGGGLASVFALGVAASLGIVQGASFAALAELNPGPADRARAAGAIAQLGNLGTTVGTPLLVWITARAGEIGLALFVIGFSALGVAIHAVQARRRLSAEPLPRR
ncbi:MFS transporter [Tabrizicola oligotrophica]|uniref:MFS transporter n=1 Tax=Tabrizicola oligotrophica TaxID=2710650 RepID=UPI002AB31AE1|nr:MFS transporter [Tabrizicola oligotrophica]